MVTNDDVIESVERASHRHLTPEQLVSLRKSLDFAFKSAGTRVRYLCGDGDIPHELCVRAGRQAIARSRLDPAEIDLVLYVGIGRGFLEPATANVFQDLLGLSNATCFDILDACASWLRALEIARNYITFGGYRNVMIINGEFLGRYAYRGELKSIEEFEHWFPGATVGEAATATILSSGDEPDEFAIKFRTWGDKRNLCIIPLANYREYLGQDAHGGADLVPMQFSSYGTQLLRFGASKLVEQYRADAATFEDYPYDLMFGHAASDGICDSIGRRCGLDMSKFQYTHRLYGNTVSASLPIGLSTAYEAGVLQPGQRLFVLYASAGVSTALLRFRYYA